MFLLSLLDHYLFLRTHMNIQILLAVIHVKMQALLKIMGAQPWTKAALLWLCALRSLAHPERMKQYFYDFESSTVSFYNERRNPCQQ